MSEEPKIKMLKSRVPKTCVCPNCGTKQVFKSAGKHWKTVKDINLDESVLLKVQVVRAKCLNPNCTIKSFTLLTPCVEKYARSTNRLKMETIAEIVADNFTVPRMSFNINSLLQYCRKPILYLPLETKRSR